MFEIPVKQIIVNDDAQVQLLNGADGTAYADGDVTTATSPFIMAGLITDTLTQTDLIPLTPGGSEIESETSQPAVKEVNVFTITAGTTVKGDVFRLVFDSLNGSPTEYQNDPIQKIYQLSVACADADAIGVEMKKVIDADIDSKVTITEAAGVVTITALEEGVTVDVYSEKLSGTAVKTNAKLGVGTYDDLKNLDWSKGIMEDQNQEYYPKRGVSYTAFRFKKSSTPFIASSGGSVPDQLPGTAVSEFLLYVDSNLTLHTALLDLKGDLDAI